MADHFYGLAPGDESPDEITTGTSTTSEIIELRVNDGNSLSTLEVVKALDTLRNYFVTNDVPA